MTAMPPFPIDKTDRRIIKATQAGLPLCDRPYAAVADTVGIGEGEVIRRLQRMLEAGVIRRIAAVPNHYRLGYVANGMTVWDVDDDAVRELGRAVGRLPFVSHSYLRPRHRPVWPYNLFAMVHGKARAETDEKAGIIAGVLGDACYGYTILYSTRILKKTGLRLEA
ncbi:MAG: AsnC family transcriptional regulator [Rhodospirillales bacterium]|jgi:DNA-binding Lrp family transcriptional regulator|nr:AsnC family transcriptional regulator [Rhodospirillales bacterium]